MALPVPIGRECFAPGRVVVAAAGLTLFVVVWFWSIQTDRNRPPQQPNSRTTVPSGAIAPPGDDVVVYWVDEETPVFVQLAQE